MTHYAIGIDIGGTSAKLALVRGDARIITKTSVPCDSRSHWRGLLADMAEAAAGLAKGRRILGVGIGCAGCIDVVGGIVRFSPNLPRWRNVPLRAFMSDRLGLPCVVDNDVNMMALGELRYGAARGALNACCITIGTGVGGGIIIGGNIYRGSGMTAGEVGHVPVVPEGIRCVCGSRGCVERYIGKEGIIRLARTAMRGKHSILAGKGPLTPLAIERAARKGDPAAGLVWERAGYYLGLLLVGIVNVLNPDVIVVGGGIANAGDLILAPARNILRERALKIPARHVKVVRSALGEDAGAIGAASELFPPYALRSRRGHIKKG
ncbi:MAG: ROK family protein [Candidatus Aureabacteria bacterium]|nr:ROK family protein [Candidatus Auribacterota bacterium]